MDGFINLFKPKKFTSHDALNIVRRSFPGTKIGHGGTLDPDATGVLPVCLGKATRLQEYVMGKQKQYEADIVFGITALSLDMSGDITVVDDAFQLDEEKLGEVLAGFIGVQQQIPPVISAIKKNGVPLYKLAKKGQEVETEPREIEIYGIRLLQVDKSSDFPRARISVDCSKGTYIRSLGRDIGEAMGTVAVIDHLVRNGTGIFSVENAVTLSEIEDRVKNKDYSFVLSPEAAVADLRKYTVTDGKQWKQIIDGNESPVLGEADGEVVIFDCYGSLMALGKIESEILKPQKILWEPRKRKGKLKIFDMAQYRSETPLAVAIGNFDGVHLGHRLLIDQCVKAAEKRGISSAVLTFSPHPQVYFQQKQHFELFSPAQKAEAVDGLGVDCLLTADFNRELAEMSPETFVEEILKQKLRAEIVYVGENFFFGKDGVGTAEALRAVAGEKGIEVVILPELKFDGETVSSSRIRKALSRGDVVFASRLLKQTYYVKGTVKEGRKLGRTIGFPTANLDFSDHIFIPQCGVYIANAFYDGKKHPAVACIGHRPTVEAGQKTNLEVHILDGAPDLYGKELKVQLLCILRGEKTFADLEELKAAIAEDVQKAKNFFEKRKSNSCNSK